MAQESKGGIFCRRPDKRLVKEVVSFPHKPKNWVHMNTQDAEVKFMEIKKYSAAYFNLENKINRPGYDLISCYNIQNPFLFGNYMLRKEQMEIQLGKAGIKEKYLYFPVPSFKHLDIIARMNIGSFCFRVMKETLLALYSNATDALAAHDRRYPKSNPRAILSVRVLLGHCFVDSGKLSQFFELESNTKLPINSWTISSRDFFLKLAQSNNEMYPESLLIYRRTGVQGDGPPDRHETRLEEFLSKAATISYSPGTRYNPQEVKFIGNKECNKKSKKKTTEPGKQVEKAAEKNRNLCKEYGPMTTEAIIEMVPLSRKND